MTASNTHQNTLTPQLLNMGVYHCFHRVVSKATGLLHRVVSDKGH